MGNFETNPTMKRKVVVDSKFKLKKLCKKLMKVEEFAFDTETNSLKVLADNSNLIVVGISISWGNFDNYYIPLGHRRAEDYHKQLHKDLVVESLQEVFDREDFTLIGANLKFDMHVLTRLGIKIKTKKLFDVQIASWLCDENEFKGLKDCAMRLLRIPATKFGEVINTVTKEVKKDFGLKSANKASFDMVLIKDGFEYALADSFNTWKLYVGFLSELENEGMDEIMFEHYVPLIDICFRMEEKGVTVDIDVLEDMAKEIQQDLEKLEYDMFEIAGVLFNPASDQQKQELLFGYVKPDKKDKNGKMKKATVNQHILDKSFNFQTVTTTATGAPQTNGDVLYALSQQGYRDPRKREGVKLAKMLLEFSALEKLNTAFIRGLIDKDKIYEDGKVHPNINIVGTDSGRFSYSDPNLQQLPSIDEEAESLTHKYPIRSMFIGSIDEVTGNCKKIIAADYNNLEMRVLAHFSEDENLLEMFEKGLDTHGSTAVNMFELDCDANTAKKSYPHLRQAAKTINFMLMYGGGAQALYNKLRGERENPLNLGDKQYLQQYGVRKGVDVAQIYIDKYFTAYSGVASFIKSQKRFAHRKEFVWSLLGRKRRLHQINGKDFGTAAYEERVAVNASIQGSAGDITTSAQKRIDLSKELRKLRCEMIVQVHDEIVFECPEENVDEAITIIKTLMEHPFGNDVELNLPLSVNADSGWSYQEAK